MTTREKIKKPTIVSNWRIARDLVAQGNEVVYSEGGNSMLPLIKSHQPVTLSPVDATLLEKGDIVLVKVNRYVYTHLVKALRRGQVQIGNNRGRINGWTSLANVYGIVSAIDGKPVESARSKIKGGVAERPIASTLKVDEGDTSVGSNPTPTSAPVVESE